ncbi:hypothetical protein Poli38472_004907 [Pythium oligandrum]|uniref:M96 mating-specific protein family n=1 Tax=Pythium oligandrum TaxID=41045 RepID=A0A8K1CBA9_PYTOL|nr:hypothetical protein Poli38472_004907 [Pythium oligandrum]|eukprot:TMW59838.1 hypothetical protein Poli38472_004907 [Pythium oligandrum]
MSWLELPDDPATLQAALAMIDAMDDGYMGSVEGSGSSEHTEESEGARSPEPTTPVAVTRPKRFRTKDEIEHLKQQVTQLAEKLATLQLQNASTKVVPHGSRVWEGIAGRQKRHREIAELENAKLRTMLDTQLRVSQNLMRLLQKGSACEDESLMILLRQQKIVAQRSLTNEDLFTRLDELYELTSSVFAPFSFDDQRTAFRDIRVSDDDPSNVSANFWASWTLPFPADLVAQASWASYHQMPANRECGRRVEEKSTTFIADFHADAAIFDNTLLQGAFVGKIIAKRYFSRSEHVIVSNMRAEMAESVQDATYQEDRWFRVTAVPSDGVSPLTQVQINRRLQFRIAPPPHQPLQQQSHYVQAMSSPLLSMIENEMAWRQRTVEHLLLTSRPTVLC